MASQKNLIKLKSSKSPHVYYTRKNKKTLSDHKVTLKKFDPTLRKHVIYKEMKK